MQSISTYIPSKPIRVLMYTLGVVLAFCVVFTLGVQFGAQHHPRFEFRDMRMPPPLGFNHVGLPHQMTPPDAPGFIGKITNATLPNVTAQSHEGDIVHITISSTTAIRAERGPQAATTGSTTPTLHVDDIIIVIGEPSDAASSTIDARFIRILPPPPFSTKN